MGITDEFGKFIYVNGSFAATLGYSKQEIIGMHITQILSERSVEKRSKPKFKELIKTGRLDFETTWITKVEKRFMVKKRLLRFMIVMANLLGPKEFFAILQSGSWRKKS